jgi:hypothetical protein
MTKRKPESKTGGKRGVTAKQQRDGEAHDPAQIPSFTPFGFMKDLAQPPRPPVNTDLRYTSIAGRQVWRQASAVNDFNPDGISLLAIDMEIRAATIHDHAPLYLQNSVAQFSKQAAAEYREDPTGARIVCSTYTLKEADCRAVQDGDAGLADLARAHPLALLDCLVVQSAIARWVYASWNSADSEIKKLADDLLARAHAPKPGRKRQHDYNPAQLRQAYDDLVAYGELLHECYRKTKNNDELFRWLPDCLRRDEAGMMVLDEQEIRRHRFPSPSTVAIRYLKHSTKMSPSLIHQLVDGVAKA